MCGGGLATPAFSSKFGRDGGVVTFFETGLVCVLCVLEGGLPNVGENRG